MSGSEISIVLSIGAFRFFTHSDTLFFKLAMWYGSCWMIVLFSKWEPREIVMIYGSWFLKSIWGRFVDKQGTCCYSWFPFRAGTHVLGSTIETLVPCAAVRQIFIEIFRSVQQNVQTCSIKNHYPWIFTIWRFANWLKTTIN